GEDPHPHCGRYHEPSHRVAEPASGRRANYPSEDDGCHERENVCESNQEGQVSVTKGRARSHDLLALLVDDEEVDLALRGRRLSKLQSFLSPAHERGKDRPLPFCVSIP